jgi:hypothetical protein
MGGDIAMELNQIIRKIFLNSSSFVLLINSNFGSGVPTNTTADAEDYTTPKRTTEYEVRTQLLALTDGQKVAQKQAEVLTYKLLRNVLGEEFLRFATKHFATINEDDIEEKWNATFEPSIPYNDANKRNVIRKLIEVVRKSSLSTTDIQMLKGSLFDLEQQTKEVPLTRIEESTTSYFESIFPGSRVTTSWKRGGDQLGCVAEVLLSSDQILKYYVKTHSEGLKSGHSSAAKLVNPAELLVYKVLEGLGVGCQSHFFGRDGQNLYIATLDANVEGSFKEYEHFKDAQDPNVQRLLWGSLTHLPTDALFSDTQHQQAESLVASDATAQNFVREATKLDLIARILGLEDFQTNPSNYGFTRRENGVFIAKAIDFRVPNKKVEEFEKDHRSFNAFLNGNGEYNYSSTGAVMYYALTKRQQYLRVHEALRVIDMVLYDFIKKVDIAYQSVSQTLSTIPMVEDDQISTQSNLGKYAEIIKANFLMFKDHLQKYR